MAAAPQDAGAVCAGGHAQAPIVVPPKAGAGQGAGARSAGGAAPAPRVVPPRVIPAKAVPFLGVPPARSPLETSDDDEVDLLQTDEEDCAEVDFQLTGHMRAMWCGTEIFKDPDTNLSWSIWNGTWFVLQGPNPAEYNWDPWQHFWHARPGPPEYYKHLQQQQEEAPDQPQEGEAEEQEEQQQEEERQAHQEAVLQEDCG